MAQKKKHIGQEQSYFLCRLAEGAPEVHISDVNPEFQDFDWVRPEEFKLEWVPKFKHEVYIAVMQDFFDVTL